MNRRQFLLSSAIACLFAKPEATFGNSAQYQEKAVSLWPNTPPGGGGPRGRMFVFPKGDVAHIATPTLTILTPPQPNGHGVLIAGGGGYKVISIGYEAMSAARWLVARGYTAYILTYRLPSEKWNDGNLVSLQDAQRALRIIGQYEKKISVLGFSAGGHLMGMAALRTHFASYEPQDALDDRPIIVNKAALIYPIITIEKPYTHTSTHNTLVGKNATVAQDIAWSVQTYVTPQSPSFFLVQAENDPISNPKNTLIMAEACEREHVSVTMYRYAKGGHGFALGKRGTPASQWPEHYQAWLDES